MDANKVRSSKGEEALKSGIGAAIGAITRSGEEAAIGAGAGSTGEIGVAMATRGDPANIPAEPVLTIALSAPVSVEERKQR